MRAYFTPQAEIDLEEIGDYIALDNPGRAVSFIQEQHCEKIADGPLREFDSAAAALIAL
jgi:toxin ParE1/3/4